MGKWCVELVNNKPFDDRSKGFLSGQQPEKKEDYKAEIIDSLQQIFLFS